MSKQTRIPLSIDTFVDYSVSGFFLLAHQPSPPSQSHSQTHISSPDRLIALGDVHGDLDMTKQSLRLATLIDAYDKWIGGSTTLIQVGDVLDRGGQEIKILYFLEKLRHEATRTGGGVITMNGNHEIVNIKGDFRLLPDHIAYGLEGVNEEVRNWIEGTRGTRFSPDYCRGSIAVVWLRKFSNELPANCDCSTLNHLLSTISGEES